MKKIILLSGHSQRFLDSGFTIKPLVQINKKTVIEYVIDSIKEMSDLDYKDYFFIVKKSDTANYHLDEFLYQQFPNCSVFVIDDHREGPVYSILQIIDSIEDSEEVLISYCDLYIKWDISEFINFARSSSSDGSIVSHTGFHPHRINNKYFAYMIVNGPDVLKIQEKSPFTQNPDDEYASGGIYFFKTGSLIKKYFKFLYESNNRVNNEFYVTMTYNKMIEDGLKITHLDSKNYVCLGTPMDVNIFSSFLTINKFIDLEHIESTARYFKQYE